MLEDVLHRLTDEGGAVLLVSHRLQEVLTLCQRVTVLRDGQNQGVFTTDRLDEATLLTTLLGRPPEAVSAAPDLAADRDVTLTARNLTGKGLHGLNFRLRQGEIVGFTGLVGSGHDELPYLIAGSEREPPRSVGDDTTFDGDTSLTRTWLPVLLVQLS